ncbi:MAG: hypothetical protein QM820_07220 [Minicystis sp.]
MTIPDGPDFSNGTSVGTIYFELDAEERGSCRYYGAWDDASSGTFETACYVAESKTRGHGSCSANSRTSFGTMVALDGRFPCWGFDTFARPTQLFMLAGIELPDPGGVIGMIQWTAATPMVSPFHAQPYP